MLIGTGLTVGLVGLVTFRLLLRLVSVGFLTIEYEKKEKRGRRVFADGFWGFRALGIVFEEDKMTVTF